MILPSAENPVVLREPDGCYRGVQEVRDVAVFPGAFNPLHIGHLKLLEAAERLLKTEVIFELSLSNVEKTTVQEGELKKRLRQFRRHRIAVTNAAMFQKKAKLFPECCFIVGFDTAVRIVAPEFYGGSASEMLAALEQFQSGRHCFLVGGRLQSFETETQFCSVSELPVPAEYSKLFNGIHEADFREDISSTQLRDAH